jgi:serine protease Do
MMKTRLGLLFAVLALTGSGCTPANGASHEEDAAADLFVSRSTAVTDQDRSAAVSDTLAASRSTAIVRAAGRVAPAVVSINVIRTQRVQARTAWESFFMPPGAQRRSAGFGSGVIVREDGIVLTNDHVIRDATQIRVTLPDGRDLDAELVGTDPLSDIAVLRIRGDDLPVAPVGTVTGLLIGEWAVAIGNPLGTYAADSEPTVTAGVVSAVGRNIIPSSDGQGFYFGMIQTDASINPGNSGGPLVNALGEIIGINTSIISRSGGSEGLGFAIPIDRALRIADDLVRFGEIRRAWVGIDVEPVEADAWGRTRGVRVGRVAPGSPAAQASIAVGARLLVANGRNLTGPLDFEGMVMDLRAGDRLQLEVEGRDRPVTLEAVPFPSVTAQRVRVLTDIELITVTPQIQVERALTSADGALITDISAELQAQLGLRPGDVIVQINRTRVRSAEDAAAVFESLRGTGRIVMYFERNGDYNMRNFYWSR